MSTKTAKSRKTVTNALSRTNSITRPLPRSNSRANLNSSTKSTTRSTSRPRSNSRSNRGTTPAGTGLDSVSLLGPISKGSTSPRPGGNRSPRGLSNTPSVNLSGTLSRSVVLRQPGKKTSGAEGASALSSSFKRSPSFTASISNATRSKTPKKSAPTTPRTPQNKASTQLNLSTRLSAYTPAADPVPVDAPDAPKVETVAAKLARKRWLLAMRMVSVCNEAQGSRKDSPDLKLKLPEGDESPGGLTPSESPSHQEGDISLSRVPSSCEDRDFMKHHHNSDDSAEDDENSAFDEEALSQMSPRTRRKYLHCPYAQMVHIGCLECALKGRKECHHRRQLNDTSA